MLKFAWVIEEEGRVWDTNACEYSSLADCQKDLLYKFPTQSITIFKAVCKTASTWENLD